MKISVVTISYNQVNFLKDCINSVLKQENVHFEYIIVDALSSDGSIDVINGFGSRLDHVICEKDDGPADGLNKGFSKASGDVLYYLNADDLALPGAFEQVSMAFARHPECDVIYGDGIIIDSDGLETRKVRSTPGFSAYRYVIGGAVLLQQATFIRRSAFEKVGGFNAKNRTCWDGELAFDLSRAGARFRHVPREFGAFRIHPASISGSNRVVDAYREDAERMAMLELGRSRRPLDRALGFGLKQVAHLRERFGL